MLWSSRNLCNCVWMTLSRSFDRYGRFETGRKFFGWLASKLFFFSMPMFRVNGEGISTDRWLPQFVWNMAVEIVLCVCVHVYRVLIVACWVADMYKVILECFHCESAACLHRVVCNLSLWQVVASGNVVCCGAETLDVYLWQSRHRVTLSQNAW